MEDVKSCTVCGRLLPGDFAFMQDINGEGQSGYTCANCFMGAVDVCCECGNALESDGSDSNTNVLGGKACTSCFQRLVAAGEWDGLGDDDEDEDETTEDDGPAPWSRPDHSDEDDGDDDGDDEDDEDGDWEWDDGDWGDDDDDGDHYDDEDW